MTLPHATAIGLLLALLVFFLLCEDIDAGLHALIEYPGITLGFIACLGMLMTALVFTANHIKP